MSYLRKAFKFILMLVIWWCGGALSLFLKGDVMMWIYTICTLPILPYITYKIVRNG